MNQLLRLPLLKYTYTEKKSYVKKKKEKEKQYHAPSPRKKRTPTKPQTEVLTATVKEQEPSTVAARIFTPEAVGILGFLHFYVNAT